MAILVVQRLALLLGRFLPKLGRLFGAAHFLSATQRSSGFLAGGPCKSGTEHLQGKHALRGGRIDRIMQAAEMRAARFELLDNREQVTDGAGEAIEPDHDQGLARADLA